jgi:branched-subunit amino acid aminotransferase/4-amino-4-deoxychorismate lyase
MRGELPPVPGTTRKHVPRPARTDDLVVLERRILIDDFEDPDEAFLTVSMSESLSIDAIEERLAISYRKRILP